MLQSTSLRPPPRFSKEKGKSSTRVREWDPTPPRRNPNPHRDFHWVPPDGRSRPSDLPRYLSRVFVCPCLSFFVTTSLLLRPRRYLPTPDDPPLDSPERFPCRHDTGLLFRTRSGRAQTCHTTSSESSVPTLRLYSNRSLLTLSSGHTGFTRPPPSPSGPRTPVDTLL